MWFSEEFLQMDNQVLSLFNFINYTDNHPQIYLINILYIYYLYI